ncbi:MAG: glycoside hydrolase family 16 protein [Saprospiraceae bacterium]
MKHNHPIFYIFTFIIAIILFENCSVDTTQELPARNYTLVWSDEFDGSQGSSISSSNWTFDIGNGVNGWGNGEYQFYTDRTDNVALDGSSNLIITARRETYAGHNFTSARIKTEGKFTTKFGRIEARMKLPVGPGIWPAFWMLGESISSEGWPLCGEIDIMELRGQEPNVINGTVHGPGYSGGNAVTKIFGFTDDRFDNDYHIFAIEWGEDYIDYFVDNTLYQRITPDDVSGDWVFDQPFFIILNIAVGGNYVGFPTEKTPFPQQMIVDYVRVYKEI